MRPRTGRRGGATYELTVAGSLGPVLRNALLPFARASCELQTVLRVETTDEGELTDVVQHLDAQGVEFATITEVPREDGEG